MENIVKRLILACLIGSATACATNYDAGVKIEKTPSEYKVLIGEFDGSIALLHGSPKQAEIRVSDGTFSCKGISTTGEFSTNLINKNKIKHLFYFSCDDGSTGQVPVLVNAYAGGTVSGIGIGVMSNGSKIKVIIGDMTGKIAW